MVVAGHLDGGRIVGVFGNGRCSLGGGQGVVGFAVSVTSVMTSVTSGVGIASVLKR